MAKRSGTKLSQWTADPQEYEFVSSENDGSSSSDVSSSNVNMLSWNFMMKAILVKF